jgi:uncharacterized membrane protein
METRKDPKQVRCEVTGGEIPLSDAIPIQQLRAPLIDQIRKDHPNVDPTGYVSQEALNQVRLARAQQMLVEDAGTLTALEKEVLDSLSNERLIARDALDDAGDKLTFGQRLADRVAAFGGSWAFIIAFFAILALWITINSGFLLAKSFDPYPFILMNLILSCLAALQAPVIMMSQNRQEAKDRIRSEHDYQINLKAELEIRVLREGLDRLAGHQWQQLMEVQQMQMDMIQELRQSKLA